jgi:hypothetical protein
LLLLKLLLLLLLLPEALSDAGVDKSNSQL